MEGGMNHKLVRSMSWSSSSETVEDEIWPRKMTTATPMTLEMRFAMIMAFLMRKRCTLLIISSSKWLYMKQT
jgi:hypothetical protein